jgi:hypothetical protein
VIGRKWSTAVIAVAIWRLQQQWNNEIIGVCSVMVEVAAATATVTAIAGKSYEVNDQVAEVKAGAVVRSASGAHLEEPSVWIICGSGCDSVIPVVTATTISGKSYGVDYWVGWSKAGCCGRHTWSISEGTHRVNHLL